MRPLIDQLLAGSNLVYLVSVLLIAGALAARRLSEDEGVRRRSLVLIGFVLILMLVAVYLGTIPERTRGFVEAPDGVLVPGLVENPLYRFWSVGLLIVGLLVFLMAFGLIFVDLVLVHQLGAEVPNILRDVGLVSLFFVGTLIILGERTDLEPTGLFTTAGVVSVVVGLALQDTLGNLFSGLALQTERSFEVGNWVQFGEREGVVTDISWRATKLRTRQNDLVIIPNTMISKDVVINFSAPSRIHAIIAKIGVHYRHPPAEVIEAIEEAAEQTDGVLRNPHVDVRTWDFGDFAITYNVKYWIRDYEDLEDISKGFMTRIWYSFQRSGIEIPFPIRNVYLRELSAETDRAEAEARIARIRRQLRQAEIFDALSEEEISDLADRARIEPFFTGETVMQQGTPGDSMYIIDQGKVKVVVTHDGRSEEIAELGPMAIIGEMALMTGASRTATVVTTEPTLFFVVDRDGFRETLLHNPRIAERISETLAERQAQLEETQAALHEAAIRGDEEDKTQILSRIWDFFGFRGSEPG
jgi:small-conductance mechanosensitive channel/CRP-like cAMP-binding protein